MLNEEQIIEGCLQNDSHAQETLYRRFAPKMFGICLRFTRNKMEAEDVLQDGFIKVFTYLKDFKNEGSLEGWIRRTMINTAINYYKKMVRKFNETDIEQADYVLMEDETAIDRLSNIELLQLIQELPDGYRMVFNLAIIEGYSHKEIGDMLNISENTSKSQLSRARNALQMKIKKTKNP
ncbi:MAG: sigma-70 family RNA polymerase sigma factor [Bacteroidetes bacterium]|nr:sigma-70 family RNA polymerase sigma factor [Bacteroidota bacterium]